MNPLPNGDGADDRSNAPGEQLRRAVADLWSQSIDEGEDHIAFHDHFGNPTRIRHESGRYFVSWVRYDGNKPVWDDYDHPFESARQAALHAFQGPEKGRF